MSARIQWLVGLRGQKSQTRALALLAVFVGVQIADGCLTAFGIGRFGVAAEANPMLALPIILFGPAAALTVAKGVAVGGAVVLYRLSRQVLLATLTVMYLFVAILPWALAFSIS
jgi:hypothetical protein